MSGAAVMFILSSALIGSLLVTGTLPDSWIGRPIAQAYRSVTRQNPPTFDPTATESQEFMSRCEDLAIRQKVVEIFPDYSRAGMMCTPTWLSLRISILDDSDFLLAHAQALPGEPWKLVAVLDSSGEGVVGNSELIPPNISARADAFAQPFTELNPDDVAQLPAN